MRLMLLSRAYCHLCDEMEKALRPIIGSVPLDVIDVDAPEHAALEARYGDAVPVLLATGAGEARELCRYRLDFDAVLSVIAADAKIR
ncbi:MAG TPA: glutaredoxin family protein [Casimicrobiaceae bacterium]|nr:glutaredoxin family protein [Casimicrobiaceae bacterium]